MVTAAFAGFAAVMAFAGLALTVLGFRKTDVRVGPARQKSQLGIQLGGVFAKPKNRLIALAAIAVGAAMWFFTGVPALAPISALVVIALPLLLSKPAGVTDIDRLEGLEAWTRSLSMLIQSGKGIEAAITGSARPAAIRVDVTRMQERISAHWDTRIALRGFADDINDATGDNIVAALLIGVERRNAGLSKMLEELSESVAEDVRARRDIETKRAEPRTQARIVTCITLLAIGAETLSPSFRHGYSSTGAQLLLVVWIAGFAACLVGMRLLAASKPLPRFLAPLPAAPVITASPASATSLASAPPMPPTQYRRQVTS